MNNDFRSRIVLPIVLPIVVLLTMAAFIGAVAAALLWNTNAGALMLAAVAAAGILFTVSLASSQDRLGRARGGVLVFAAVLPLLVGGGIAAGVIGDVDDDDRKINVEPHVVVPDDAPVIAAENAQEFCLYDDEGECQATDTWEIEPSQETEQVAFVFDNIDPDGTEHNVVFTELEGDEDDPAPGSETFLASSLIPGGASEPFLSDEWAWTELPEQWYFVCSIHPSMEGVAYLAEDA
ncbi:MAG: hypothetical protein ACLFRD_04965 [Nitriliruptoraceae bacterium]